MSNADNGQSQRKRGQSPGKGGAVARMATATASMSTLQEARGLCAKTLKGRRVVGDLQGWGQAGNVALPSPADEIQSIRDLYIASPKNVTAAYKLCRKVSEKPFVGVVTRMKSAVYNDRPRLAGRAGYQWWEDPSNRVDRGRLLQLVRDLWSESLLCSNAVVVWQESGVGGGAVPLAFVVDCEDVDYDNSDPAGVERFRIKIPEANTLAMTAEEKREYDEQRRQASQVGGVGAGSGAGKLRLGVESDGYVYVHQQEGMHAVALSNAKRGAGLGMPTLVEILLDLVIEELLSKGDLNAAWMDRTMPRQIKKGHAIEHGPMAGQPEHYLKQVDVEKIKASLENKAAGFPWITNFDVSVEFPFVPRDFFDPEKYKGVAEKLQRWAGPGMQIMAATGDVSQSLIDLYRVEMGYERQVMGEFVNERLLGNPDFAGAGLLGLELEWNPWTLHSARAIREVLGTALDWDLISRQSAQRVLGIDSDLEDFLKAGEKADPEKWTPVFEPRQGLVGAQEAGGGGGGGGGGSEGADGTTAGSGAGRPTEGA